MSLEEVQEFSDNYSQQLRAMKRPAKEEINALTMVASDYVDCPKFALAVVQVIERCVDELSNDRKLIPLYVLDSILKNVQPRSVYSALVIQNLTRLMATAFMAVDNNFKPKFIKLLKIWDENKIFPDSKIHEVRDTLMLMLTNGGVFPAHLNANGGQGPQVGGHAHMALGPIDVESPYSASNNSYPNQQGGGMHVESNYNMVGVQIDSYGQYAAQNNSASYCGDAQAHNNRPSNSPTLRAADTPAEHSGPRVLCPKELASRDVSDMVHTLYEARPYLCKQDGRRFREKRELEQHLDDLFAKNKSRKERSAIQERLWFRQADEWSRALDVTSLTECASAADNMQVEEEVVVEEEKSVVASDDWCDGLKCVACHEVLKKVWDGDSDEWIFRGVMRLDTGTSSSGRPSLVHQTCCHHHVSHTQHT